MNKLFLADAGRRVKLIILSIAIGLFAGALARAFEPSKTSASLAALTGRGSGEAQVKAQRLLHPLTIQAQRQRSYGGGRITVEEELPGGEGYLLRRASYNSDGYKIYSLIVAPSAPAPINGYPVVILLHGYMPPDSYETTEGDFVDFAKRLAAQGYIVFRPDLRGFGESWGTADGAYFSSSYTADVLNLRRQLISYPGVNPKQVGLFGYSMGARIALNAAVVAPEDFSAMVLVSGSVGRLETMFQIWRANSDSADPVTIGTRSRMIELFGEPTPDNKFWQSVSPYPHLNDLNMPVQIHHSQADPIVPVEFSRELAGELRRLNVPVEASYYDTDSHGFEEPLRTEVFQKVLQYYGQTLAKG